jgi:hypothetical protein
MKQRAINKKEIKNQTTYKNMLVPKEERALICALLSPLMTEDPVLSAIDRDRCRSSSCERLA